MSRGARRREAPIGSYQKRESEAEGSVLISEQAERKVAASILESLPNRIHQVFHHHVVATPDSVALIEDGETLTYRQFDRAVTGTTNALRELGIRPGDRVLIVSENCISLACLLFATSRLDAWAIVANPRLSPRELDLIRDHSGARRVFFTADVSGEAAAHASRLRARIGDIGPLYGIGLSELNENTIAEPVEP